MQKRFSLFALALVSFGIWFGLCLPASAQTYTLSTLYNFRSDSNSSGPSAPSALIVDTAGNLYGTTMFGGKGRDGTVYELSAEGVFTVLHAFNGTDGNFPQNLTRDSQGNLYGATWQIGYPGTVFEMVKGSAGNYTLTNLYDAAYAQPGSLTVDSKGNVFGENGVDPRSCLCVFEIPAGGHWEDIYSTGGVPVYPGNVIVDNAGGVYASVNYDEVGSTGYILEVEGGTQRYDLPHDAAEAYLAGQDAAGNIYGLARGLNGVDPPLILFKLDLSTGNISRIYTFTATEGPFLPLVVDSVDNIYGVALNGFLFKITPQGQEKLLFDLSKTTAGPSSGIVRDGAGNLYGYTSFGGTYNGGTIYKLTLKK